MNEIGQFIVARLREDEDTASGLAFACRNPDLTPDFGCCGGPAAEDYWARFNADRALREVEATRRIMGRHLNLRPGSRYPGHHCDWCLDTGWGEWPCPDVRDIAATWSAHPDYDPAWAPVGARAS